MHISTWCDVDGGALRQQSTTISAEGREGCGTRKAGKGEEGATGIDGHNCNQSLLKTISLNGFVRKLGTLKSTGEHLYVEKQILWTQHPDWENVAPGKKQSDSGNRTAKTRTTSLACLFYPRKRLLANLLGFNLCRGVVTGSHARPKKPEKSWNWNLEPNPNHGTMKNLER